MPPIPGTWVPPTATQLTPATATPVSGVPQAAIAAYPTMQQFQVSPQVRRKFSQGGGTLQIFSTVYH